MYLPAQLLGVCFATCAAGIFVSNDEAERAHLAASRVSEQDVAALLEGRPLHNAHAAAILRRRWGGHRCFKFSEILVKFFDATFEQQITKAQQSEVCFKEWMTEDCHKSLKKIISTNLFEAAYSMITAQLGTDFLSKTVALVAEPMVEAATWPLIAAPLDSVVTQLQQVIVKNEKGAVLEYEKMYEKRLESIEKGRKPVIQYLTDHIKDLCKGLGLTVDDGTKDAQDSGKANEDVERHIGRLKNKADEVYKTEGTPQRRG